MAVIMKYKNLIMVIPLEFRTFAQQ